MGALPDGVGFDYRHGADYRLYCEYQTALGGMGLLNFKVSFSGADLPAVFPFVVFSVDSGIFSCRMFENS